LEIAAAIFLRAAAACRNPGLMGVHSRDLGRTGRPRTISRPRPAAVIDSPKE
jgi:hypothetical protein